MITVPEIAKISPMMEIHQRRLQHCDVIAKHSPDQSSQIGAFLVTIKGNAMGHSFNSFPRTLRCRNELYALKGNQDKYDRIIHAEQRCIMKTGSDNCYGGTLYTGCPPCKDCAKHICEAGVKTVAFFASRMHHDFVKRNPASINTAMILFAECRVEVLEVPDAP